MRTWLIIMSVNGLLGNVAVRVDGKDFPEALEKARERIRNLKESDCGLVNSYKLDEKEP